MQHSKTIAALAVTIGLLVTPALAEVASQSFPGIHPDTAVEARITLDAVQILRSRSAETPSGANSILSGAERYDLEYFRGISRERYPMTWAVNAQEVLDWIDFQASQDLPGMGTSAQVLRSLVGLAVLTMNWADATILSMADKAATFDEEIAKLQAAIQERALPLLALLGEGIFNAGFFGGQIPYPS